MQKHGNNGIYASVFILFGGISSIGLFTSRDQTLVLGLAYFSAFFAYFWLCRFSFSFRKSLTLGVILRGLLFFSMPTLSDDVYRFIWDGHLLANGISPFEHLPGYYLTGENQIPGLTQALYNSLNSPEYYSIYPPVNQFLFWVSVKLGGSDWLFNTNIIRVVLLLADVGAFLLLSKLLPQKQQDGRLANWYWLNPLVILEFTGNLHFEGLVIYFLLWGLYLIAKNRSIHAGGAIGLAIATKLLPLVLLPGILFKNWFKKGFTISAIAVLMALLSFLPLLSDNLLAGLSSSIGLYFRKFEFNASIYYLLREVGFWFTGYNIIGTLGPALAFAAFCSILLITYFGKKRNWPLEKVLLFSLTGYLLLATTVHPWYILPLIVFGLLSGYYYPIIWSFMVFVTYFGYTKEGFELSLLWVVLEYVIVIGYFIVENARKVSMMPGTSRPST